jgi:hypothetical protein
MKRQHNKINRRNFLKTMGAAGAAPAFTGVANVFAETQTKAEPKAQETKYPQVPKRKLGKTGIEVPCLSLGTNRLDNQIILRNTLDWGVNYWDTSNSYTGGNSERNIGKFLSKSPEVRKKIFIVTKASGAETVVDVEKRFQTSLKRMNTSN